MKPVLVFQHIGCETPGIFLDPLRERKRPVETVRLYEGEPPPDDLSLFSGLLVMGGPMSVNDETDYPWLKTEDRLLKQALAARRPDARRLPWLAAHCKGSRWSSPAWAAQGDRLVPDSAHDGGAP